MMPDTPPPAPATTTGAATALDRPDLAASDGLAVQLRLMLQAQMRADALEHCDHLHAAAPEVKAWVPGFGPRWLCWGCVASLQTFVGRLQVGGHQVLDCTLCGRPGEHLRHANAGRTRVIVAFLCSPCLTGSDGVPA